MDIFNDVVNNFRTKIDKRFNSYLNEVANYVIFEQTLIKKDNKSKKKSSIKYRYDEKTYNLINDFFKEITFDGELKVGRAKDVDIKDLPDELYFENNHELPFADKIYLLDKIKDSFMHLRGNNTLYDFDFRNKTIDIHNSADDFALNCKIPFSTLYQFNRAIKEIYDKETPPLNLIETFSKERIREGVKERAIRRRQFVEENGVHINSPAGFVAAMKNGTLVLYEGIKNVNSLSTKCKVVGKKFMDNYYTSSYVSSLVASKEESNYPLLGELYNGEFDFQCSKKDYIDMMNGIMNRIMKFYDSNTINLEYIGSDKLKNNVQNFLNNEIGSICRINNFIVTSLRNARSHANLEETNREIFGNPLMLYHDAHYNSHLNLENENTIPSFYMIGYKKDFDQLFNNLIDKRTNPEFFKVDLENELTLGKYDLLEKFLEQFEGLIKQARNDLNINTEYLYVPIGNAENFIDFIRKVINGTFVYEANNNIGQR